MSSSTQPTLVTGVGSLPHVGAADAVDFVARTAPEMPFWPQLPQRAPHEGMLRQFLGAGFEALEVSSEISGYVIKDGEAPRFRAWLEQGKPNLSPVHAGGWHAYIEALDEGQFADAKILKGQVTGAVVLAAMLYLGDRPLLEEPRWLALIAARIARCARWQAEQLMAYGKPVQIWVDDPALGHLGSIAPEPVHEEVTLAIFAAIREAGAKAGWHCCTTPRFDRLASLEPDVFSFDAHRGLEAFFEDSTARAWWTEDRTLALGIVPTGGAAEDFDLNAHQARLSQCPLPLHHGHQLITATCGLALETPEAAEESFRRARALTA